MPSSRCSYEELQVGLRTIFVLGVKSDGEIKTSKVLLIE